MRVFTTAVGLMAFCIVTACSRDTPTSPCCTGGQPELRVVNGFTEPIDVLIDGSLAIEDLASGTIGLTAPRPGNHTLVLQASASSKTRSITTNDGALSTIAAVRNTAGSLDEIALDDTNSIVPAGATKVRVLHLAPNAGTLQVYRTQPDWQQPISWQFPFDYQPDPNSLSAPFLQSTVGTWEVRAWKSPTDSTGWTAPLASVTIPLASGEKRTVVILDKQGGGIKMETF